MMRDIKCSSLYHMLRFANYYMCIKCSSCDNYIHMTLWVLIVVIVTHGNVTVWMTRDVKCSSRIRCMRCVIILC